MSPALNDFLITAFMVGFCLYYLSRVWPRKRHLIQGFKKMTPEGIPVEKMPDYIEPGTRFMLCLFFIFCLCLVSGKFLFEHIGPPPDVAADPPPALPPPRIARSSTARGGDIVTLVCGGGKFCALAATAQDAVKLDRGQMPSGKVVYVKNGASAVVDGYDPEIDGSDTADVFIFAGADDNSITLTARSDPDQNGYVPGRWMHKIRVQGPKTVYQVPSKGTQGRVVGIDAGAPPPPPVRPPSAGQKTGDSAPE